MRNERQVDAALRSKETMPDFTTREISDLLDFIEFCEGALVDQYAAEGGLDPATAKAIARMASAELVKHGRHSIMVDIENREKLDV